jgi:AraC-like DNA-binding protein
VIFNLREDVFRCYTPETLKLHGRLPGALIAGPRTGFQVIDTEQQMEVMGVHLRAGGMRALSRVPTNKFTNQDVPLSEIWGGFVAELHDKIRLVSSPETKLQVLEILLMRRLREDLIPHRAIPEALRLLEPDQNPVKMAHLAESIGLSSRRFIEIFTSHVGLSPKSYARIRRFQRALRAIHGSSVSSWADLAFDCGWCDQAHMIRDFKQFSGVTPTEYGRMQGEIMLRVPVAERGQICPIPETNSTAY